MSKPVVLVPTRSRPQNVEAVVDAWWQTGAFGPLDLVFVYDADDLHVDEYRAAVSYHVGAQFIEMPEWMPMVPKLNQVAVVAAQDRPFVAFMGDDHLPRTRGWASALYTEHLVHGSAIVYGRDGIQDQRLPTWWSMDSRLINRLGRMVPAPVQHLFCDNAVMELGKRIDSLVYRPDILIEHMHPVAGKGKMDEQYARVNRAQQYERDGAAFRAWMADGREQDATLLADIWG